MAFSDSGGDSEKNNRTKKEYIVLHSIARPAHCPPLLLPPLPPPLPLPSRSPPPIPILPPPLPLQGTSRACCPCCCRAQGKVGWGVAALALLASLGPRSLAFAGCWWWCVGKGIGINVGLLAAALALALHGSRRGWCKAKLGGGQRHFLCLHCPARSRQQWRGVGVVHWRGMLGHQWWRVGRGDGVLTVFALARLCQKRRDPTINMRCMG